MIDTSDLYDLCIIKMLVEGNCFHTTALRTHKDHSELQNYFREVGPEESLQLMLRNKQIFLDLLSIYPNNLPPIRPELEYNINFRKFSVEELLKMDKQLLNLTNNYKKYKEVLDYKQKPFDSLNGFVEFIDYIYQSKISCGVIQKYKVDLKNFEELGIVNLFLPDGHLLVKFMFLFSFERLSSHGLVAYHFPIKILKYPYRKFIQWVDQNKLVKGCF